MQGIWHINRYTLEMDKNYSHLCQTSCGINEENKDEYIFSSQRINTIRHSFTFVTLNLWKINWRGMVLTFWRACTKHFNRQRGDIGNYCWHKSFVCDWLVTGKVDFILILQGLLLIHVWKRWKEKGRWCLSCKKVDKVLAGYLAKNVNLEVALKYPITSMPLSLANPDGTTFEMTLVIPKHSEISHQKMLVGL